MDRRFYFQEKPSEELLKIVHNIVEKRNIGLLQSPGADFPYCIAIFDWSEILPRHQTFLELLLLCNH